MKTILLLLLSLLPSLAFGQVLSRPGGSGTFSAPVSAPGVVSTGTVQTKGLVSTDMATLPQAWITADGTYLGAAGAGIAESLRCTATLATSAITAATTATQSIACTGVRPGAECSVGGPSTLEAGLIQSCLVSALDTITLRTANVTAAEITPAGSQTVSVRVTNTAFTTLIPDLPGTVAHPIWSGTAISDAYGTWTMNSTVPQVARSGNTPPGAGPFASDKWYRLGTGVDALDFAGDFLGIMVVRNAGPTTSQVWVDTSQVGGAANGFLLRTAGGGGGISFYTYNAGTTLVSGNVLQGTGTVSVVAFGRDGTAHQYLSGSGIISDAGAAKVAVDAAHGSFLGVNGASGATPLLGNVIEAWFAPVTPTVAMIATMTREVYRKLGGKIVSVFGDSNTLNYAQYMPPVTLTSAHFTNDGVSGDTTTQMLARWPAISATRPTHVVIMGGTNDRTLSAAVATQNLTIIVEDARARGIKVVLLTVLPFSGASGYSAGQETIRTTINTAIRAYGSTAGVTVIDTDVFGNGATPPALATAYDVGDHLHLNTTGMAALAALVGARIQ
jgi:lysophospholipase L1-like esterase